MATVIYLPKNPTTLFSLFLIQKLVVSKTIEAKNIIQYFFMSKAHNVIIITKLIIRNKRVIPEFFSIKSDLLNILKIQAPVHKPANIRNKL